MAKRGRPIGSKNKKPKVRGPVAPTAPPAASQRVRRVKRVKGLYGFPEESPATRGLPGAVLPNGGNPPPLLRGWGAKGQVELMKRVAASGLTPLEYLLDILRDTSQSKIRRDWAAERSAPYCHSRIASVVHTGRGGGPIQTLDLSKISDEQLAALEAVFGKLIQSSGHISGAAEGEDST